VDTTNELAGLSPHYPFTLLNMAERQAGKLRIPTFKGELKELQIYFRKIPLHQLKFLVVSVLSNSLWLPRNFKNDQNETTKLFSVGNTFRQVTM